MTSLIAPFQYHASGAAFTALLPPRAKLYELPFAPNADAVFNVFATFNPLLNNVLTWVVVDLYCVEVIFEPKFTEAQVPTVYGPCERFDPLYAPIW